MPQPGNRREGWAIGGRLAVALILILTAPFPAKAEEGRAYFELSGGYKAGDFGTATRSELNYVSPVLGYVAPQWDVSVTAPYLYTTNKTGGASTSASGLGDVILRGGWELLPEGEGGFSLAGALAAKLPTAEKSKGLGTGEADYGAFFTARQRLGQTRASALIGYIKVGQPPSITYNDVYLYGAGVSQIINSAELYVSFEGRRALVPGGKDPQEFNAGFFYALTADYAVKGSAFAGRNKGGPDHGLIFGIVSWF
jgi:hypothetical protein